MESLLPDVMPDSSSPIALAIVKITSIFLLFIISILLGIFPSKVTAFNSNPKLIAFVNSFSAGLFLGLGMMHLLPESINDYDQHLILNVSESSFPTPFFVTITSFSFIMFLERVLFQAHNFLHLHADLSHEDAISKESNISDVDELHSALILPADIVGSCNQEKEEETFKKLISSKERIARVTIDQEFHKIISESKHQHKVRSESQMQVIEHGHVVGPYAILIALSIHGVFEGAAIGIQHDTTRAVDLMIAVVLHKWAEALTLGVALFRGKLSEKIIIIQVTLFSIAGPLGIGIGWALSSSSFLVSSLLKAASAGTFLYIAATELIVEEFSISTNMYGKFLLYMIGLVFMGTIVWFE